MFPLSKLFSGLIRTGTLTVTDAEGRRHVFGGAPGPSAHVRLHDKALYWKLFVNPELHGGEAYMDGTMTFPDSSLRDFMVLFAVNKSRMHDQQQIKALNVLDRAMKGVQQANPIGKAQKNVAHHYDVGNALYEMFLDEGMFYSCAYYRDETETLEQAQINKCRLIAAKLGLKPGQRVLDIGSGWGGLARYLAKVAGVEVLGVTLSKEQYAMATARTEAEGLSDRVTFQLVDYREVAGPFDRIVSVGMFEHVGVGHYDEFFRKVHDLLAPEGVMLLHSIGKMSPPATASRWLRKYIFPGGYAPSLSEVFPMTERNRLWVTDVEFLRLHYAWTLEAWWRRFEARRDEVRAMYDERFCRMWEFYLLGCEMMFRSGAQEVFQMQLSRRRDASPLTRDYIFAEQERLKAIEAAAGIGAA